jgi:hypothetical protein
MSGTVKSAEYNNDTNRSLLHVESNPLPVEMRNHILGEVFGMLPEEEELPFRVLDDEAAAPEGNLGPKLSYGQTADQSMPDDKTL